MPQTGAGPDQEREPLRDERYYSRESYREFPRRSTSTRRFEDDQDRYDRNRYDMEGRTTSNYNRAPEYAYRSQHEMPPSRYEDERERYRRTERYDQEQARYVRPERHRDQPYRHYGDRYRDESYGRPQPEYREGTRGYNLRCRDIMSKSVTTCSPTVTVRGVADMMENEGVGSIPVVENGKLIGIITDRDIVCRILAQELDTRSSVASDAMTQEVVTCTSDEPVIEAVHKMAEFMVRRIPVVDHGGRLRGIISIADIALEAELDSELARALEQISRPMPHSSRRYAGWS
ncbi:MAG TPA: CBS domain-containing protein [Blastocatellia bacterium]|nr:CBS domain-containing protein [Blastocatellia bacterium]